MGIVRLTLFGGSKMFNSYTGGVALINEQFTLEIQVVLFTAVSAART